MAYRNINLFSRVFPFLVDKSESRQIYRDHAGSLHAFAHLGSQFMQGTNHGNHPYPSPSLCHPSTITRLQHLDPQSFVKFYLPFASGLYQHGTTLTFSLRMERQNKWLSL